MSRGFVKEDDQEEAPFVPPRAALPDGFENLVTPEGFQQLREEKETLIASRKAASQLSEREGRRERSVIDGKISQLDERINTARVIEQPKDPSEVRFGLFVTYEASGQPPKRMKLKIVGVDEADLKHQKVAFVAPIVQAMMGKRMGDAFEFELGNEKKVFKIIHISVD